MYSVGQNLLKNRSKSSICCRSESKGFADSQKFFEFLSRLTKPSVSSRGFDWTKT